MKQKEVEDVFGGKEEFANADSMASKLRTLRGTLPYGCWNKLGGLGLMLCFLFLFPYPQLNAPQKTVMATAHTFSSCRFGVQTSR